MSVSLQEKPKSLTPLEKIVKDILLKFCQRFKQELDGENEENLDRILREYREKVARISWKLSQKWSKWDDDGPVLMPDYTRLYYRKGSTEVLVQEFPPQIRLLSFQGSLAKRQGSGEKIDEVLASRVFHYSLALPYVVFLFRFRCGMFDSVCCAFSDRPLKRLEEKPQRPYFSNIDSNLKVCLGASFDNNKLKKGQLAQQVAFILDYFWQSVFSDEWSSHYWSCKSHFAEDKRLCDLDRWQAASAENPLFVVEDVDWLELGDQSFGDMLVQMVASDSENNSYENELYKQLVDEFFGEFKKGLTDDFNSIYGRIIDQQVPDLTKEFLKG